MTAHRLERLRAEPTLGLVVDPFEGEVVGRLRDDAQIGQRIADFGAFVEPETADDAIVEADLDKPVFEFPRLILRAHQDRDLVERCAFAFQPLDLLAYAARFLGRVPYADDPYLLTGRQFGPQGLAKALAIGIDQARGRRQDLRRRTVVLFQLDH